MSNEQMSDERMSNEQMSKFEPCNSALKVIDTRTGIIWMEIFFLILTTTGTFGRFFHGSGSGFFPNRIRTQEKSPIRIGIRNTGSHTIGLFIVIIFRLEAKQVSNETLIGTMVS